MQFFGKSDTGKVRSDNQDRFICGTFGDGAVYSVVCDGMGGVSGGSVASEIAVKAIQEELIDNYKENLSDTQIKNLCVEAISIANSIIFGIASKEAMLSGMGTTAVLTIIKDKTAYIVHIGDSRAYILSKEKAVQLTKDHSFVQDLVDSGKLSKQDAKNHPKKNIITRAIGVSKHIEAEYTNVLMEDEDVLLLCTDGLTNHITDEDLINIVNKKELSKSCDKLINLALERGGNDNITLVLISE